MLWLGLRPSSKQEGGDEVAGGWSRKEELMCRWVGGWGRRTLGGRGDQQAGSWMGGWISDQKIVLVGGR